VDHTIRVGDGVVVGSETIQVESLNWRNVTGRKRNGALVVIPNAKLANDELQVLPRDRPVRGEIAFKAPAMITPQQVTDLVTELISDLLQLDPARPIAVAPVEHELTDANRRYAVRYRAEHYWEIELIESEICRLLWYGFRRHRIAGMEANDASPGFTPKDIAT
jgi:small-conductance mechanosensitive channel